MSRHIVCLAALFLASGCEDPDFVEPAFLHVDAIDVVRSTTGNLPDDDGFYTSDIVAAFVAAHYEGEMTMDTIGCFELPFTVPILHNGPVDYIDIYPAIAMSGVHATLPYYPCLEGIHITGDTLVARDTLNLDTLHTHYTISTSESNPELLLYEPFEPVDISILMDSNVTWIKNDAAGARTGYGYGTVHVDPDRTSQDFYIDYDFLNVQPASNILYLELDYRGDLDMQVNMRSAINTGANETSLSVMVVYASDEWKHMYINLGRTWSQFNHNPDFKLFFSALNLDGTGGDIYIDNLKVITTSASL